MIEAVRNDMIAFDRTDDTPLNRAEWCESISATSTKVIDCISSSVKFVVIILLESISLSISLLFFLFFVTCQSSASWMRLPYIDLICCYVFLIREFSLSFPS